MIININKKALLEEAFLDSISKFFATIIPTKLDKFIKEYFSKDSKKILNEATFKQSKRINGETNMTDTCLTSILKLIGKENLINKYKANSETFLKGYLKFGKPIKITKKNIKDVKKGTVILFWWEPDIKKINGKRLHTNFDGNNLISSNIVGNAAHFGIVLDPEKYLILHSAPYSFGNDGVMDGIGSGLDLTIEVKKSFFTNPSGDSYALDMRVINKL